MQRVQIGRASRVQSACIGMRESKQRQVRASDHRFDSVCNTVKLFLDFTQRSCRDISHRTEHRLSIESMYYST